MNKRLFACCLSAAMCLSVLADGEQTVTVNGSTVNKTVTQITFNADNVILHYSDNTSEEADMANVSIAFDVAQAINMLSSEPADAPVYYFDMQGRQLPAAPQKGMYIMKKGNKIVKLIQQ